MKTLLTLDRIKDGTLLERRRHCSRSFTKGLWDLLYVAHAQLLAASPYPCVDIIGSEKEIDSESQANRARYYKSTLRLAAPSGGCGASLVGGYASINSGTYAAKHQPHSILPGECFGIQIGGGSAAVSPGDRKLDRKIYHGTRVAIGSTQDIDYYDTGDDGDIEVYNPREYGVIILPTRGYRLSAVQLLLYREGSPGILTISVRGVRFSYSSYPQMEDDDIVSVTTDGDTLPTTAPYEWREVTFPTPVDVQPGIPYVIRLIAPSGTSTNSVHWRRKYGAGEYHPRYWLIQKTNSYYTTSYNYQPMFRARGTALAELEYGGCEIFGLNIANPNGRFNIRRLFRNESGGAVTVNECGIYSIGSFRMVSDDEAGGVYAYCIARDLISPAINVLNSEDLAVTYTPQITV